MDKLTNEQRVIFYDIIKKIVELDELLAKEAGKYSDRARELLAESFMQFIAQLSENKLP